ncbi:MAG: hypothetical protein ACI4JK_03810 [Oscillospiraceae bacterium]
MITVAVLAALTVLLSALAILFFTAKPVMLEGFLNPKGADGDKHIDFYSFSGMSFSPCDAYVARNYERTDDCSSIAQMALDVNQDIESKIYNYLEERYSSYNVSADLSQNDRSKTVIAFSGTGNESEDIQVNMTIDWKKAAECGDDEYIEIS